MQPYNIKVYITDVKFQILTFLSNNIYIFLTYTYTHTHIQLLSYLLKLTTGSSFYSQPFLCALNKCRSVCVYFQDLMNREKKNKIPSMQVGFIDAICLQLYEVFTEKYQIAKLRLCYELNLKHIEEINTRHVVLLLTQKT